jgi:Cu+-exporting ATPase
MATELLKRQSNSLFNDKCFHCNNPITESEDVLWERNGETLHFCCQGCRAVSQIILDSGNLQFYDLRGSQIIQPAQSAEDYQLIQEDYLNGDLVAEEYFHKLENGAVEVFVNITNIHCSACVWLNEKVLKETPGIESIRINFATARAQIHFYPDQIQLSEIFKIIESLGYKPKLHSPWKSQERAKKNSSLLIRMGVAGFCFGNIMLFGTSLYAGYFTGIEMEWKRLLHYLSWAFATPVYFYSGYPFLLGAWNGLKQKKLSMDFLLVTGISLAYFYSIYVTLTDRGEIYFDSVCMIYFFILLGKYLEDNARIKSNDKLSQLVSDLPEIATRVDENGEEKVIRTAEIKKGFNLLVRAGERVPTDGIILSELGYLDESFLTGESIPITKKINDKVLAGSIAISIPIKILAEVDAKNSTLSRLKTVIEQAIGEKPNLERITDRIATYFISVVFLLASGTFLYWFYSSHLMETALINTISVLIVACPCALGLAVPTALVMNHIRNSKEGVIIRNPDSIETLSKIDTIFLDKTGTLTEGKLKLENFQMKEVELSAIITYNLERYSSHPIASNLCRELIRKFPLLPKLNLENVEEISGKGMQGELNYNGKNYKIKLGSQKFLEQKDSSPFTRIYLCWNNEIQGYWELNDSIRIKSISAISNLLHITKNIRILSGDSYEVVSRTAKDVGLEYFHAETSPEEKLGFISERQNQGKIVAMVGDGINDSAALAKADIGVSMGIAADLSMDKSDLILVQNDLQAFYKSILYAKETFHLIRQNIAISFIYNSVMLPLAAMGLMAPVICAAFMALSSLSVVANSLRIKKAKNLL